jgi:hypothetical protein
MESTTDAMELLKYPTLTPQLLDQLLGVSAQLLALAQRDRTAAMKEYDSNADHDDEQKEQLDEDLEDVQSILDSIVSVASYLAKHYG